MDVSCNFVLVSEDAICGPWYMMATGGIVNMHTKKEGGLFGFLAQSSGNSMIYQQCTTQAVLAR